MDDKTYNLRVPKRWVRIALIVGVTALVVAPLTAVATHSFTDVGNDNTFHDNIEWLADNDVTRGCNPPENSLFCPDEQVTREQMAAFMQRLAQAFGAVGDDANDDVSITSTSSTELLSVTATPKDEAHVVLNAHVVFGKVDPGTGVYLVQIRQGSCTGDVIAEGGWLTGADPEGDTVSLTGLDTVSANTTYKLCVNRFGTGPDVNVSLRGMTATWMPTS